ncbi:hypothetical protein [Mycoplasma sp. 005V]|uniref:hypothetical protein n=1 Tax=unclassified Mycoplasma TaxID=2683645 RepID=UPI003A862DAF
MKNDFFNLIIAVADTTNTINLINAKSTNIKDELSEKLKLFIDSFSKYEKMNCWLTNIEYLQFKQNKIAYENKLDIFSVLMQINEIFNKEKNDLISMINNLKSSIHNVDVYGFGY